VKTYARKRMYRTLFPFLSGILLGSLTYYALNELPSVYAELQRLGFVESPSLSSDALHLGIAAVVALLYAVYPLLCRHAGKKARRLSLSALWIWFGGVRQAPNGAGERAGW